MIRITLIAIVTALFGFSLFLYYSGKLAATVTEETAIMQCRADCYLHSRIGKKLPEKCINKCKRIK